MRPKVCEFIYDSQRLLLCSTVHAYLQVNKRIEAAVEQSAHCACDMASKLD